MLIISNVISGTAASAAPAATTTLPAGILIGDSDGIKADRNGYYYIDARGLKPNDVITKVITIENQAVINDNDGELPYTLTMSTEPLFANGPEDLLDKVHLTLKLDGRVIYTGPCRGNGEPNIIERELSLGDFRIRDKRTLEATLTVASDLKLSAQKSDAEFKWHFYAFRVKVADAPIMGVLMTKYGYLLPVGGFVILAAVMLPLKKRRDEKRAKAAGNE